MKHMWVLILPGLCSRQVGRLRKRHTPEEAGFDLTKPLIFLNSFRLDMPHTRVRKCFGWICSDIDGRKGSNRTLDGSVGLDDWFDQRESFCGEIGAFTPVSCRYIYLKELGSIRMLNIGGGWEEYNQGETQTFFGMEVVRVSDQTLQNVSKLGRFVDALHIMMKETFGSMT